MLRRNVLITVPNEVVKKWQRIIDLTAEMVNVPACLVMKTDYPDHEVFLASQGNRNPYYVGQKFALTPKLYCNTVLQTCQELVVPDAMIDEKWMDNEDLEFGMRFYVGHPVLWPDGEIFGTICILDVGENAVALERRDLLREFRIVIENDLTLLAEIDRRKQTECWLKMTLQELEDQVKELAIADKNKDEFLALLGHELRNPLAPLRTSAQLLIKTKGRSEDLVEIATLIDRQVVQMARIVDDLLDVTRIARGKLKLRRAPVALKDMVDLAMDHCQPLLDKRRIVSKVEMPTEPIYLNADIGRMGQVFSNLLHNACKYACEAGQVSLTAFERDGEICIQITDDGVGISKDHLETIFDMFMQVGEPKDSLYQGSGLGLTYVRQMVEAHQGTVLAKSEGLGKGSEFTVRLPTIKPKSENQSKRFTDIDICKILIVDDKRDSADSLSRLLGVSGFETKTANDGLAAIEIAKSFQPDVILLDLGMPVVDGYETCARIREESWGRNIVVIALTGWGQPSDVKRTRAVGFDRHLVKPASLETLLDTFADITQTREVGRV